MNFEERRFGKNWHLLFHLFFAGFASLREAYGLGCYLREIRSTFWGGRANCKLDNWPIEQLIAQGQDIKILNKLWSI
jgi:hypothetical protein